MAKLKNFSLCPANPQTHLGPYSYFNQMLDYFFWMEDLLIKNVFTFFPDFLTSRFWKTGSVHPVRILGPRGAQGHLKHENRSSQSANSSVTLLLF